MQHSLPRSGYYCFPPDRREQAALVGDGEDRTYQAMTIAAIVTVLASIWVF